MTFEECITHIQYHWIYTKEQKTLLANMDYKKAKILFKQTDSPLVVFQALINGELN